MPPSGPNSPSSPAPSEAPSETSDWGRSATLFALTVASVFVTYFLFDGGQHPLRERASGAFQFTATLLSILFVHEFGHYIAARIHRVPVSPPYFIPLPMLGFGTMGAIIRMRDRITTRNALLDIGAAGPLAGLVIAVPLYIWGIRHSQVIAVSDAHGAELGSSLLIKFLDYRFGPAVPEGHDILVSPMAHAAWAGFFVTMINLLPLGQLDAGHVAFALFGKRQDAIGRWIHRSMLAIFFAAVLNGVTRDLRAHRGLWQIGDHVQAGLFWFLWFEVQAVLGSLTREPQKGSLSNTTRIPAVIGLVLLAGVGQKSAASVLWICWFVGLAVLLGMELKFGILNDPSPLEHPPTDDRTLSPIRKVVAAFTLLLFVLLFMPTPMSM